VQKTINPPPPIEKQVVCQLPSLNIKPRCDGIYRDTTDENEGFEGVPQIFSAALAKGRVALLELNNKPVCTNVAGGKKCGTLFTTILP